MTRVLVVDDSAVVRRVLQRQLDAIDGIEVVGVAPDPYVARDLIVELKPDVITLDLEMPRMDGLTFLKKLMATMPIPTLVVSSLTEKGGELANAAIEAGAVDVLCKPGSAYSVEALTDELAEKIQGAAQVRPETLQKAREFRAQVSPLQSIGRTTHTVIAIGASTGGTTALETYVRALPPDTPGTIVTLHMPPHFTKSFAKRLDETSRVRVKEAETGDSVVPGVVLIAPGDKHLLLRRSGARWAVEAKVGPRVNFHIPSVDVMFRSVANAAGQNAIGIIMTGMGADGAKGMKLMRDAGAYCIGQNESTCVVYGMPKAAFEAGAVENQYPLRKIAAAVLECCGGRKRSIRV